MEACEQIFAFFCLKCFFRIHSICYWSLKATFFSPHVSKCFLMQFLIHWSGVLELWKLYKGFDKREMYEDGWVEEWKEVGRDRWMDGCLDVDRWREVGVVGRVVGWMWIDGG